MFATRMCCVVIWCLCWSVLGHLNIYLSQEEVKRILGLHTELYYVREGVVNDYAMSWTVPVAADIQTLLFTWRSTGGKPLLYNMAVQAGETKLAHPKNGRHDTSSTSEVEGSKTVPDGLALAPPYVNISLAGAVPPEPETFAMHLPCTGAVSAEVQVTLNINVTSASPRQHPTELYFRRRKICLKGQSEKSFSFRPDEDGYPGSPLPHLPPATLLFAGVAGCVVVVVSVVLAACFRRLTANSKRSRSVSTTNQKRSETSSTLMSRTVCSSSSTGFTTICPTDNSLFPTNSASAMALPATFADIQSPALSTIHGSLSLDKHLYSTPVVQLEANNVAESFSSPSSPQFTLARNGRCALQRLETSPWQQDGNERYAGAQSGTTSEVLVDPGLAELQESVRHLQEDPEQVNMVSVILRGTYAKWGTGVLRTKNSPQDTKVLIKTLDPSCSNADVVAFLRSGAHFAPIRHPAILGLTAVAYPASMPPLLVYRDHGCHNLKLYLQNRSAHLMPEDLQRLALQAAQGLAHLHSCGIRHGDLAARNCLVTNNYELYVSDAALSADLFPRDYRLLKPNGPPRPVAWMSLESLADQNVDTPADVWSWGVLAWELTTLCQQPYDDLAPTHLAEYLKDGYRLAQPPTCPDVFYQLMAFCWAINPQHRPRATLLVDYLSGLDQNNGGHLSNHTVEPDLVTATHIPKSSFLYSSENETVKQLTEESALILEEFPKQNKTEGLKISPPIIKSNALRRSSNSSTASSSSSPPGLAHFPSTVYSTPTSLAGDVIWKLPDKQVATKRRNSQTVVKSNFR